jgi:hypothetical protein
MESVKCLGEDFEGRCDFVEGRDGKLLSKLEVVRLVCFVMGDIDGDRIERLCIAGESFWLPV